MTGTDPIAEVEFAENPEPRCACVLLLDTSGSMQGDKIDTLNKGLQSFRDHLIQDELASMRVEVAVVTFDSAVNVVCDFVTAEHFIPPVLTTKGQTYMGGGITTALDLIQARKQTYRKNAIRYYRPWIFMITDGAPQGEPTDVVESAAQRVRAEEEARRVAFFAVGVEGADMARLARIAVRAPVKLTGLNFVEMFVWLSSSMQRISNSKDVDEMVTLPPPTGWGAV